MVKLKGKATSELSDAITKRTLSTSVKLNEVAGNLFRFEASAYNIDVRGAVKDLQHSDYKLLSLFSPTDGLCEDCSAPLRMKRNRVSPERGIGLLSSSDIISLRPEASQYLSKKLTTQLDKILIAEWDVLISRSGTIGNIGLAGKRIAGLALSEHGLRLKAPDKTTAGYVAAFLRSKYGRLQLIKATYGSVVTHIEPEHLRHVLIPRLHPIQQNAIGELFVNACIARDRANELLDKADALLHEYLGLPHLDGLTSNTERFSYNVKASQLAGRFEASYHTPLVSRALAKLKKSKCSGIVRLDDDSLTLEIRAITKFRKRVYVEEGGIPLLSSKQLFQIDPIDVKKLAKGAHTKDLPEIALEKNMLAVSCSGTIGRVQIIPEYMQDWTANQHATRILATNDVNAGYLYAWLASAYGYLFITRNSYGSVILEIDKDMLAAVPVPLVNDEQKNEIGALVLEANRLRDEAWQREQSAIAQLETLIKKPAASSN